MFKKLIIIPLISSSLFLFSCHRDITSNTYTAASVGETAFTYQGTVINVRKVNVQKHDELGHHSTGIGLGAIGGGVAGTQFGKGKGNIATTVGGAILGGLAGAYAEKHLHSQDGLEYVVKLTNNQVLTVVQGLDIAFTVGQKVMVLVSHDGRSRIIADSTPYQDIQTPMSTPQVRVTK